MFGDQGGEEALAVGFAGVVGGEGFGAEAVFMGVGGGFAFAFGGDGATREFAVGPGGEGELGGGHLVEFLFSWNDRRTGLCKSGWGFGVKSFFFWGKIFENSCERVFRGIWGKRAAGYLNERM